MTRTPVALQLYTVRSETSKDFIGTLKEVARQGYDGVEFAGYGGLSAKELKTVIDDLGLQVAGSHVGLKLLETELEQVIEYNLAIGNQRVVCPAIPAERRTDADGYREVARSLTAIGKRLKEQGLQLGYHNHAFEFEKFDGKYALDILYDTDPELVQVELDVYWVRKGGEDPVALLKKLGKRCTLIHFKDMAASPEQEYTEVGAGVIDFKEIAAASGGNACWYIVEHDNPKIAPLESTRISLENLRKLGLA